MAGRFSRNRRPYSRHTGRYDEYSLGGSVLNHAYAWWPFNSDAEAITRSPTGTADQYRPDNFDAFESHHIKGAGRLAGYGARPDEGQMHSDAIADYSHASMGGLRLTPSGDSAWRVESKAASNVGGIRSTGQMGLLSSADGSVTYADMETAGSTLEYRLDMSWDRNTNAWPSATHSVFVGVRSTDVAVSSHYLFFAETGTLEWGLYDGLGGTSNIGVADLADGGDHEAALPPATRNKFRITLTPDLNAAGTETRTTIETLDDGYDLFDDDATFTEVNTNDDPIIAIDWGASVPVEIGTFGGAGGAQHAGSWFWNAQCRINGTVLWTVPFEEMTDYTWRTFGTVHTLSNMPGDYVDAQGNRWRMKQTSASLGHHGLYPADAQVANPSGNLANTTWGEYFDADFTGGDTLTASGSLPAGWTGLGDGDSFEVLYDCREGSPGLSFKNNSVVLANYTTNTSGMKFYITNGGATVALTLDLHHSGGSNTFTSSAQIGTTTNLRGIGFRAQINDSGTDRVDFYYINGAGNETALGVQQTAATGPFTNNGNDVDVGQDGGANPLSLAQAVVGVRAWSDHTQTTEVLHFDTADWNAAIQASPTADRMIYTGDTGETWTYVLDSGVGHKFGLSQRNVSLVPVNVNTGTLCVLNSNIFPDRWGSSDDFTLACAISHQYRGGGNVQPIISTDVDLAGEAYIKLFIDTSNVLQFEAYDGTTSMTLSGSTITDAELHTIVVKREGNDFYMYLDGVEDDSDTTTTVGNCKSDNDNPYAFGIAGAAGLSGANYMFAGTMDHGVYYWNRALDASDIADVHTELYQ